MNKIGLMIKILNEIYQGNVPRYNMYNVDRKLWQGIAKEIKGKGYAKHVEEIDNENNINLSPYTYSTISIEGMLFLIENEKI